VNWHQVHLDEVFPSPWKNGRGIARELLSWPQGDDWQVRISIADIERDGPFSSYPGVTRWFAVLSGEGVKLRVDGHGHSLRTESPPFSFDGGAKVECDLLDGFTQDFNLMLQGRVGRIERVAGRCERACRKGSIAGVYSHDHDVSFLAAEVRIAIPPRTLAWKIVQGDERIDFATKGALWFEVQP